MPTVTRKFHCVGAFVTWRILYAPHACGAPRNRRCARTRFTQLRALTAPVSGVRGAICTPLARVAIVTTRTYALLYRSAPTSEFLLAFPSFFSHETLPVLGFVPLRLCGFVPLRLCSALLSALLFSELCSSGSVSAIH